LVCRVLHLVGKVPAGRRWRQGPSVGSVQGNGFSHDVAKLGKYLSLVETVTATQDQAWCAPYIARVLIGPFDNLGVPSTVFHSSASSGKGGQSGLRRETNEHGVTLLKSSPPVNKISVASAEFGMTQ